MGGQFENLEAAGRRLAIVVPLALGLIIRRDSVSDSIAAPRFRTTVVSPFAGLALLLALAGMYAVTSYLTAQRTSEFGLRLALGSCTAWRSDRLAPLG